MIFLNNNAKWFLNSLQSLFNIIINNSISYFIKLVSWFGLVAISIIINTISWDLTIKVIGLYSNSDIKISNALINIYCWFDNIYCWFDILFFDYTFISAINTSNVSIYYLLNKLMLYLFLISLDRLTILYIKSKQNLYLSISIELIFSLFNLMKFILLHSYNKLIIFIQK